MDQEQQDPYAFINEKPRPKAGVSFDAGSQKQRIIVVAVLAVVLIVVAAIVMNVLASSGKKDLPTLYQAAAAQQDLIDLTAIGINTVRDGQMVNLTSTTNLVITSQVNEMNNYFNKRGIKGKLVNKNIAAYKDSSYKKVLDDAKQNGNYDDSYKAIYANRIDAYRVKLNNAYAATKSKTLKTMLSGFYTQLNSIDTKE